jgi:hypothetical protein
MLEKSKSSRPNRSKRKFEAVRFLVLNKDISILLADKSNCAVVLDESEYKDKLDTLLESRAYVPVPKEPTARIEKRVQILLFKEKTSLLAKLK